jgi:HlyD family secretion protein
MRFIDGVISRLSDGSNASPISSRRRTQQQRNRSVRYRTASRSGISVLWLLLTFVVVAGIAGALIYSTMGKQNADPSLQYSIYNVQPEVFEHKIVEPGEVESSNYTEIRCEVQSRNSSGIMILEIIPNGTEVEVGRELVKFDASALENERNQQQIACNNSAATLATSKAAYDTAVISKDEYLYGTFVQEEKIIQSEVFVAEENLRRAEEYARYSEKLAARGYVTGVQVEADRFAVEKSRKDVETAQTKLRVLRDYTKTKMVKTMDSNIEIAKSKMTADENTHKLDDTKLALINSQIDKCTVRAPVRGKVVYANVQGFRGNNEVMIQEGTMIRERQAVIRIPDPNMMQVMAKINESRVGNVRAGMKAKVELDAYPDMELSGTVTRVDEYPLPTGMFSAQVKQYSTFIKIDDPPDDVRSGLTAKVEIDVEKIPAAITVPIEAVVEHNGFYYCLVKNGDKLEARWVPLGASNAARVVIRDNKIQSGEQVIQNPDLFLDSITEYPLPPPDYLKQQQELIAKRRAENQASKGTVADVAVNGKSGSGGEGKGGRGGNRDVGTVVAGIFEKYDANKDKILDAEEILTVPADRRERMVKGDTNSDGKLDKAELLRVMNRPRQNGGDAPGGPDGQAGAGLPNDPSHGGPGIGGPGNDPTRGGLVSPGPVGAMP